MNRNFLLMGKFIEDWSARYAILKPFIGLVHRLQYRKVIVTGLENIPRGKPVILAPNHQNALMDALAIVFTAPLQPVFLARADIFKSKHISSILRFFKIMPVYRIRDGKEQLHKNEQTFDTCVRIMKKGKSLCLFPEAAHIGMRSMLPHKKAIPRLAFLAGNQTNYSIELQVVPVGINYSHYSRYRSDLVVNYGPPINVKPFFEMSFQEGETKATIALRDKIFTEVSKCCIHVPDKEYYAIYEQAFNLLHYDLENEIPLLKNKKNPVVTYQYLIEKLEPVLCNNAEILKNLEHCTNEIDMLKNKLGLSDRTLLKGGIDFIKIFEFLLFQVLLFPFTLAGLLINGWLFMLVYYGLPRKVKDPQFISSFAFGGSLILFPLWVVVQLIIYVSLGIGFPLSVIFSIISVPVGIITWESVQAWLRFLNRIKFNQYLNSGNILLNKLIKTREKFRGIFDDLIGNN